MNNTTNLAIATAIMLVAATLVVGTVVTTQSAFAYSNKKEGDENSKNGNRNDNGNTITIQKCKQAATQSGFDNNQGQECENLICTHPGENATCVQEGAVSAAAAAAAQTPVKLTCEQCFTKFLTPGQITGVLNGRTPETACPVFRSGVVLSESEFRNALGDAKVDPTIANELIACLRDAGVVFGP
jgi:hypothetical protein